ncbi:hypothetical protein LTR91_026971, partial [Friedmanniomyces endolithicus]
RREEFTCTGSSVARRRRRRSEIHITVAEAALRLRMSRSRNSAKRCCSISRCRLGKSLGATCH